MAVLSNHHRDGCEHPGIGVKSQKRGRRLLHDTPLRQCKSGEYHWAPRSKDRKAVKAARPNAKHGDDLREKGVFGQTLVV